jgi:hypothetical protein
VVFWRAMLHARWLDLQPSAFRMRPSYAQTLNMIQQSSPALVLALPVALIAYFAWKRTRYFGNTAPLLVAGLLFILAVGSPGFPGQGFHLVLMPFIFVFVAGIFADLIETRQKLFVTAGLCGLLGAGALWNMIQLARLG